MIKSLEEFETVMCEILKGVKDKNGNFSDIGQYPDDETGEALAECIDEKLISGYTYRREGNEPVFDFMNPRITYSGLKFLDAHLKRPH